MHFLRYVRGNVFHFAEARSLLYFNCSTTDYNTLILIQNLSKSGDLRRHSLLQPSTVRDLKHADSKITSSTIL